MKNKNIMMKTYIPILLSIIFFSCEKNEFTYDTPTEHKINNFIEDTHISLFDRNSEIEISLSGSNDTSIESVIVSKYGDDDVLTKIADASINTENNTATFNTSSLGDFNFSGKSTGSYSIAVNSNSANGNTIKKDYTISVDKAIKIATEYSDYIYKDTLGVNGKTQPNVIFNTHTIGAIVDEVTAEWKKGALTTTYTPLTTTFNAKTDTIKLRELDLFNPSGAYNLVQNDTIFFKFTAKSGSITDVIETSVAITPQPMLNSGSGTLSSNNLYFNLLEGKNVSSEKNSEIKFEESGSFLSFSTIPESDGPPVVAATPIDIMFTEVTPVTTAETEYKLGGALTAKEEYNNGSPSNTIALGDEKLFVYKIVRQNVDNEDVEYYGYILTAKSNIIDGVTIYNFDYKEGTVIP